MTRALILTTMLIAYLHLGAQDRCSSMQESEREMLSDTAYARGVEELEALSERLAVGDTSVNRDGLPFPTITVPVVVHVLYRTEQQNISMEQIHTQMDVLNRDFAGLNDDLSKIPEPFRFLAGATNIRFQLADQDPEGKFTNGVTRTRTTVENIGSQAIYHRPERGGIAPWPQPHYLNVWVCELEGNALGFAILPSSKMSDRDGIVMSPRAFGTTGLAEAPYDEGRTFIHEVGHYFGLRHLWGSDDASCNSTDYVSDTPAQLKENFGCKNFPSFSCTNAEFGDMFMNYMDYGNDSCMLFFTQQQVALMHLVLMHNRKTLFHSAGVTGTLQAETLSERLHVYPNPVRSLLYIEGSDEHLGDVQVWNTSGVMVHQSSHNQRRGQIDLSSLPSGLYFLRTRQGQHMLSIVR